MAPDLDVPSTAQSSGAGSSSQATANFGTREDSVACEPDPAAVAPDNRRRIALPALPRLGEPRYGNVATVEEAIMVISFNRFHLTSFTP